MNACNQEIRLRYAKPFNLSWKPERLEIGLLCLIDVCPNGLLIFECWYLFRAEVFLRYRVLQVSNILDCLRTIQVILKLHS